MENTIHSKSEQNAKTHASITVITGNICQISIQTGSSHH